MQYTHPEHPISADGRTFLASLTQEQRNLQILAQRMLGSSYFIEKTHGFRMWMANNRAALATKTTESKPVEKKE